MKSAAAKRHIAAIFKVFAALLLLWAAPAKSDDFAGMTATLDECIKLGLERNYGLGAKREELKGVLLQADAIAISVMPKLDLNAGSTYTTPVSGAFEFDNLFPPDFWEKIGADPPESGGGGASNEHVQTTWGARLSASYALNTPIIDKAISSELNARREELLALADDVRFAVTGAYMNALLAQRAVEVAGKSHELAEEQHRHALLRYENKVAPWFEVVQAEVQVSLAKENLEESKYAARNSLKALYLSMGLAGGPDELTLEPGPVDDISNVIAEIAGTEMPGFPDAFVETSYTFRQLSFSIDSLEHQAKANKNFPVLSGFASWQGQDGSAFQEPNSYSLGVNLNFRIFDSGEAKNRIEQLEVQRNILSIKRNEFSQAYMNQLDVLANDLEVALLTYETAKKTLDAASEGLKIATIGYREGITTSLELMDSRTRYLSADFNLFSKKVAIYLAYDAIRKAIGYERYGESAIVTISEETRAPIPGGGEILKELFAPEGGETDG